MHDHSRLLQWIKTALILISFGTSCCFWLQLSGQLSVLVLGELAGFLSGFVLLGAGILWLLQTRPAQALTWFVTKLLSFLIAVVLWSMYFTLMYFIVLTLLQAIGGSSPKASCSGDWQSTTSDPAKRSDSVTGLTERAELTNDVRSNSIR